MARFYPVLHVDVDVFYVSIDVFYVFFQRFYSADAYFKLWVDRAKLFTIADRQYNSALELYVEISRNLPIMDSV